MVSAIAPDSFFQMSLLKEIYEAYPSFQYLGGIDGVRKLLEKGTLLKRKEAHTLLNVIAMGLCYAPDGQGDIQWPIDQRGVLNEEIWKKWLKHDPIYFLREQLFSEQSVYLDVGLF